MRRTLLAALILCASACSKKPQPRLKAALESAKSLPPCSTVIAGEWPYGWPVPLDGSGGKRFKIFFYPMSGTPDTGPTIATPAGEAVLDLDSGKPASCGVLPGYPKDLSRRRWPAAVDKLDMKGFAEREDKLLGLTEAVAAVYGAKRAPYPGDAATAKDYMDVFESMAEPDLLPYYYRLNPAFWEWLRGAAGRSIPKAR